MVIYTSFADCEEMCLSRDGDGGDDDGDDYGGGGRDGCGEREGVAAVVAQRWLGEKGRKNGG